MSAVIGRPSEYSAERADRICEQIVMGKSLRAICADPAMPSVATIFNWFRSFPSFLEQYTRAKEEQAETLADEIVSIADGEEGAEDTAVTTARDRLRVDARKWVAAKLKPKVYGDRQAIEHTGKDGGPIQTQTEVRPQLTREEWLATYVDAPARPAASSD